MLREVSQTAKVNLVRGYAIVGDGESGGRRRESTEPTSGLRYKLQANASDSSFHAARYELVKQQIVRW